MQDHPDYKEMTDAFGGDPQTANRIVNALWRLNIKSMAALAAKADEMEGAPVGFEIFLGDIPNFGVKSVGLIMAGLDNWKQKEN